MIPRDQMDDPTWMAQVLNQAGLEKTAAYSRASQAMLPEDQFGGIFLDDHHRSHPRFRMDTPEHVQMSAAYLVSGDTGLSKQAAANVAKNLLEGFFGHNIRPPAVLTKIAESGTGERSMLARESVVAQQAAFTPPDDSDFAIKIAGVSRFPIRDEEEAKQAAAYFERECHNIPPEHRRTMAQAFEKKASQFGVTLGEEAQRYLGTRRSWLFKSAMVGRASFVPAYAQQYANLIEDPSDLDTLAEKVAEVDTAAGINSLWDTAVVDPWATVYDNTQKIAAAEYEKTIGGELIHGSDLLRIADKKPRLVEIMLGGEYAEKFLKNPISFFDTAGPGLQRVIVNLAKEVRIDSR